MLKHQHKTLARTLSYIARHSPGEFGLFWDPAGTMPWKELYWALQEDPELRFVREANIRELALLGIELPFYLDGNVLRLPPGSAPPDYESVTEPPSRLYFGARPGSIDRIRIAGLVPGGRAYVPLASERGLALRIAKRRESEPIVLEIMSDRALERGISFFKAGPQLYLVEAIPSECLIFPLIKQERSEKSLQKSPKPREKLPQSALSPGSFAVRAHHIDPSGGPQAADKAAGKSKRDGKGGWKKSSRGERHKRDV
ncbi:MAG: hypothetical protein LLG06_15445 [Desulfobacteraceae bacterium]|nr:hypothetical protein [Desulfobacteraceae bacterium]